MEPIKDDMFTQYLRDQAYPFSLPISRDVGWAKN